MSHAELKKRIEEGLPFTLYVADGRSFEVPHRDYVFLPPHSTTVIVAEPNPENPDETVNNIIPLLMVSGVTQTWPTDRVAEG
jgi:hypothetical protein